MLLLLGSWVSWKLWRAGPSNRRIFDVGHYKNHRVMWYKYSTQWRLLWLKNRTESKKINYETIAAKKQKAFLLIIITHLKSLKRSFFSLQWNSVYYNTFLRLKGTRTTREMGLRAIVLIEVYSHLLDERNSRIKTDWAYQVFFQPISRLDRAGQGTCWGNLVKLHLKWPQWFFVFCFYVRRTVNIGVTNSCFLLLIWNVSTKSTLYLEGEHDSVSWYIARHRMQIMTISVIISVSDNHKSDH